MISLLGIWHLWYTRTLGVVSAELSLQKHTGYMPGCLKSVAFRWRKLSCRGEKGKGKKNNANRPGKRSENVDDVVIKKDRSFSFPVPSSSLLSVFAAFMLCEIPLLVQAMTPSLE